MEELLGDLVSRSSAEELPLLLKGRPEGSQILVLLFTSDRGLCGGFNSGALKCFDRWMSGRTAADVKIITVGKRAGQHVRRKYPEAELLIAHQELEASEHLETARATRIRIAELFDDGEIDSVELIFNRYQSAVLQVPEVQPLVPVQGLSDKAVGEDDASTSTSDFEYEPSRQVVMETVVPLYLDTLLYQGLLENEAGEHAARMSAMDNATRNANEMIDKLTIEYNRARQAAITTELIEIISGAEAL
jgi:F-type H+-transporting ATPase subunit gamma